MDKSKNRNENNFNDAMNFYGTTQIATGDIINNNNSDSSTIKATYTPEPKWRSPFTLAVLTWISFIIAVLGIFPLGKLVVNVWKLFKGNIQAIVDFATQTYLIILTILIFLFILFFSLRRIVKKQIRVPLILNYAINGFGGCIVLEKIHIAKCPICGGKMKYYNKPVEWREVMHSDGSIKREVIRKIPALECKRNHEHFFGVDPAEDKIK